MKMKQNVRSWIKIFCHIDVVYQTQIGIKLMPPFWFIYHIHISRELNSRWQNKIYSQFSFKNDICFIFVKQLLLVMIKYTRLHWCVSQFFACGRKSVSQPPCMAAICFMAHYKKGASSSSSLLSAHWLTNSALYRPRHGWKKRGSFLFASLSL